MEGLFQQPQGQLVNGRCCRGSLAARRSASAGVHVTAHPCVCVLQQRGTAVADLYLTVHLQ